MTECRFQEKTTSAQMYIWHYSEEIVAREKFNRVVINTDN